MSKRIFTEEQLGILRANVNVVACSDRSISYHPDFKLRAVKQYNDEGLPAREIFKLAGLHWELVGNDIPTESLKRWLRTYRLKGTAGLQQDERGRLGRPKVKGTEPDRIKRLEAEVAYLKAENAFLAKLRAKRAERNSGQNRNTG